MQNNNFRVIIISRDSKISGTLQELTSGHIVNKKAFDPMTVLGDLLNVATYEDISPYPQGNFSFKQDYTKHPFFLDKPFCGNALFQAPLCFRSFFVSLNTLKEIITNNKRLSMSEFEILKQFLSLKFTFKIEVREIDPLYELGYQVNPINNEKVVKYHYVSLSDTHDFSIKQVFDRISKTAFRFNYFCSSIEDIAFSVLHYLILFEYQFLKCNHCGNYFAAKTLKHKYCKRRSPYKKYEHLECEQAVRNIKQNCVRRQGHVCDHLRELYGQDVSDNFYTEYATYKKAADECSSVENLLLLEQFLSIERIKQEWYQAENRIVSPHNKSRTT